jgi:hypothetical protein
VLVTPATQYAAMGYRGKLEEREQARRLRATGLPMAEIAARRTPWSAASGPRSTASWPRAGIGSVG